MIIKGGNIMNKQSDLVSIIMPAYNAEKFIGSSIESVLSQSYHNFELIIVDDGSKDSTHNLIEIYSKQDSRIKFYKNKKNLGVSDTRNAGIRVAKGKYIAFLDSDDLWSKDKLDIQIQFMKDNNYDFTFGNYEIIDEESNKKNKIVFAPREVTFKKLLKGSRIGCLTVVFNHEKIKWPGMKNIGHEDYLAWLSILNETEKGYGINQTIGYYREMTTSLSGNKIKAAKWQFNIYNSELGLGYIRSIWYFLNYAINALTKTSTLKPSTKRGD